MRYNGKGKKRVGQKLSIQPNRGGLRREFWKKESWQRIWEERNLVRKATKKKVEGKLVGAFGKKNDISKELPGVGQALTT